MKNIWMFILLPLLLFLGAKDMKVDSSVSGEVVTYESLEADKAFFLEKGDDLSSCFSFAIDFSCQDFCNDIQKRIRRTNLVNRLQRQLRSFNVLFSVESLQRNFTLYKESLIRVFAQCYTTIPLIDSTASEHYVYGLRHILL